MNTIHISGKAFDNFKNGQSDVLVTLGIEILKPFEVVNLYNRESKKNIFAEVEFCETCTFQLVNTDDALGCGFNSVEALRTDLSAFVKKHIKNNDVVTVIGFKNLKK